MSCSYSIGLFIFHRFTRLGQMLRRLTAGGEAQVRTYCVSHKRVGRRWLEPLEDRAVPAYGLTQSLFPDPTGPQQASSFGWFVATDGSFTVVGAPYTDIAGIIDSGTAYVFDSTTGALVATLANPTPAYNDLFGISVAVSGSTVVVGASYDDTGANDSGQAYVFNAATGALVATLANPSPAASDQFGFSVAVSGTTAVVGAPLDDLGATDSGRAYVFDMTTASLLATLAKSTSSNYESLGMSVAVSGNTAVIGAPFDATQNASQGAAYVFTEKDSTAPTITGVNVDGSAWTAAFRTAAGNSAFGYPAQTGASQLTDMPWGNINTIYVQFSEPVNTVTAAQVGVRGVNVATYAVSSVTMFSTTVAKIALSANIDTDKLILDIDGDSGTAVSDLAGNKLAGNWTESSSNFPTAGAAGNDFKYRFVVAVGDADRNGIVRNADTNLVRTNLFVDAGQAGYDIYRDIDGTGQTRNADVNTVRSHLFVDPPTGPGPFRPRGDFRGRENGFVGRSVRGGSTDDNDANRVDRLTSHSIRPVGRGSVAVSRHAAPVHQSDWLDYAFTEI